MSRFLDLEAGLSGSDCSSDQEMSEHSSDREFIEDESVVDVYRPMYRGNTPSPLRLPLFESPIAERGSPSGVEDIGAPPRLRRRISDSATESDEDSVVPIRPTATIGGSPLVRGGTLGGVPSPARSALAAPAAVVSSPEAEPVEAPAHARNRRFAWTLNNYTPREVQAIGECTVWKYCCYGIEEAPSTGTPHLQGYLEMTDKVSFATLNNRISAAFGFPCRMHFIVANGTAQHNITYCSKDGSFREFGTKPKGQGKRSDLDRAVEAIDAGKGLDGVIDAAPSSFIRYSNGILKLLMYKTKPRDFKTKVYWLYGATGVGKSRFAWGVAPAAYAKDPATEWWDGYTSQRVVIIDDYRANAKMNFSYLLRLFDRYPMLIQVKGGTFHFSSRVIFLTTHSDVKTTFQTCDWIQEGQIAQMERRVEQIEVTPSTILHDLVLLDDDEAPASPGGEEETKERA